MQIEMPDQLINKIAMHVAWAVDRGFNYTFKRPPGHPFHPEEISRHAWKHDYCVFSPGLKISFEVFRRQGET